MTAFDNWLKGSSDEAWPGDATQDPSFIVNRDAELLVISRGATDLAAQIVRIVTMMGNRQAGQGRDPSLSSPANSDAVVIGTLTLNIKSGDFFMYNSTRYEVIFVDKSMPGKVEARCLAAQ